MTETMLEVDPEVAALASAVPIGTIDAETLSLLRSTGLATPAQLSEAVVRTDHVVPADPEVRVRVHRPAGVDGPLPCLYFMHGGGYVLGTYDSDSAHFDRWCNAFGVMGVSVEYRLAPETPYPGPLDDCYAGLTWAFAHHDELGIDPKRIGIGGTSAGGGLAAGLALLARDRGEVPVFCQLLDCPMLDDRQSTPSSQLDGLLVWNRHSNQFGWRSYLGDLYGSPDVPAYAAAARAEDLSGLPKAYVCVGAVDGFRDEDVIYATRLNQAGVPAELHVHPGAPHGVAGLFPNTGVARRYRNGIDEWLERTLCAEPD
jgi:acetyl esterase/lipase